MVLLILYLLLLVYLKQLEKRFLEKGGPVVVRKMKNFKDKNNASRVVRLMSQSFEAQMGKMANNPNFDNISLDEQRTVAAPVAVATAVLENLGSEVFLKILKQFLQTI